VCTKHLRANKKVKYKNFMHKVARSCISKVQNLAESGFDELQWPEKIPTPKRHKQDTPERLCGDFSKHIFYRFFAGG